MTIPRGLGPTHGAQWRDAAMAQAYVHRPPYPPPALVFLHWVCPGNHHPHRILDIGAGTGDIARGLADENTFVDALEPSAAMRRVGASLPGGDHPHLRWIAGTAEDTPLAGPYHMAVAGESLHWMDWDALFPRLADAIGPQGLLVAAEREAAPHPWTDELRALIARYSTNTEYEPYDVFAMLADHPWFHLRNRHETPPLQLTQSVRDHIEAIHSRNGFSRDRMDPTAARQFDDAYCQLLANHGATDSVTVEVRAKFVWGTLQPPDGSR